LFLELPDLHFARSGIDTTLKGSSAFGVVSGVLLLSSIAYAVPALSRVPVSYSAPFSFSLVEMLSVIDGLFVIFGGLVALFARMDIERRGVLAFFVFLASIFATLGSVGLLSFVFLGPM